MLKKTIITSYKELTSNRHLMVMSIILACLAVAMVVYIGFNVRPTELQPVTQYTAFGVTHLYRDQWFYLLSFGVFALLVAFLHIALAIKIYIKKGHPLAVACLWAGIGIIVYAWITAASILNIWSPL